MSGGQTITVAELIEACDDLAQHVDMLTSTIADIAEAVGLDWETSTPEDLLRAVYALAQRVSQLESDDEVDP